jgi:hypothetical protein
MKKVLVVMLVLGSAAAASAQTAADSADIRTTALNYVEGWYTGDAARMESALHPDLAKRIVMTAPGGVSRLRHMTAPQLVEGTREAEGRSTPADKQVKDVKILDIFRGTASVRADMTAWIDYMHMAKWNGKWLIVNVLWQTRS